MNDYEVGVRHNLPFITIIDDNGNITNDCGEFSVSLSHKNTHYTNNKFFHYELTKGAIFSCLIKKQI